MSHSILKTPEARSSIKVSIIVPTYGRAEGLQKLIDSLRSSTPPDAYELVIVSSDPPDTAKAAWLRSLTDARVIFADARQAWQLRKRSNYYYLNHAIKHSSYPWIFPLSDDMQVESGWYEAFLDVIKNPKHTNIGLIIAASHVGNVQEGIRVDVIGRTKKPNAAWKLLYLSDVSIVRRDVMESIGMFDEGMDWFGSGADLSLSVEFLTDTETLPVETIRIHHTISRENRGTNMASAFSDFHYLLRKWDRWCREHDCRYEWDPGILPYTLQNRIANAIQQKIKIVRYYKNYFFKRRK